MAGVYCSLGAGGISTGSETGRPRGNPREGLPHRVQAALLPAPKRAPEFTDCRRTKSNRTKDLRATERQANAAYG
jgi:hypothetical protein